MTQARIRFLLVLVGAITVALIWYGLTRNQQPFTLGLAAGMSGKFADLGIDCRRGVDLAVTEINAEGGLNGRHVILDARDDQQDEEKAKAIATAFIEAGLPVVIGHVTSSMTAAVLPLYNQSETLLVSPTTSTPLLTGLDDSLIRVCAVSTEAAARMAFYLLREKGLRSAAVIYDSSNQAYTELWYENFRDTFLAGGGTTVIPIAFVSRPDFQFLPLVEQASAAAPEALVIVANSVDAALLCQQVRKTGWQVPLALADWAATEQLIALGGQTVEGAVISQYFNRTSSAAPYLSFKERFIEAYRTEPGFGALHSYNAAMMVFSAVKQQRRNESLKQAVLRISAFPGLQGEFSIDRFGDSSNLTFIGRIENGAFVIFEDFK